MSVKGSLFSMDQQQNPLTDFRTAMKWHKHLRYWLFFISQHTGTGKSLVKITEIHKHAISTKHRARLSAGSGLRIYLHPASPSKRKSGSLMSAQMQFQTVHCANLHHRLAIWATPAMYITAQKHSRQQFLTSNILYSSLFYPSTGILTQIIWL
jgi:hypothetical protein